MQNSRNFEKEIYKEDYFNITDEDGEKLDGETFGTKREGRTRAERRKTDFKKARKKQRIAKQVGGTEYDNLHEYSKNKIHCSCPMCSGMSKTDSKKVNKGGRKSQSKHVRANNPSYGTTNHRKGKNYKASEARKIEMMDAQEAEREI